MGAASPKPRCAPAPAPHATLACLAAGALGAVSESVCRLSQRGGPVPHEARPGRRCTTREGRYAPAPLTKCQSAALRVYDLREPKVGNSPHHCGTVAPSQATRGVGKQATARAALRLRRRAAGLQYFSRGFLKRAASGCALPPQFVPFESLSKAAAMLCCNDLFQVQAATT